MTDIKKVAIVIFYDQDGNILVQDRSEKADALYKYGFFGGKIEVGETPQQAVVREIKEELGIEMKDFSFWKQTYYEVKDEGAFYGMKFDKYVFLALLSEEIKNAKVYEGAKTMLKLKDAVSDPGFSYNSRALIRALIKKLYIK